MIVQRNGKIVIEVHSKDKQTMNTLQYKLKFFVTTGTLQVQGNKKDKFADEHFPVLKNLLQMILKKPRTITITT